MDLCTIIVGTCSFVFGAGLGAGLMYLYKKKLKKELEGIREMYSNFTHSLKQEKNELETKKKNVEKKLKEIDELTQKSKKSYKALVEDVVKIVKR